MGLLNASWNVPLMHASNGLLKASSNGPFGIPIEGPLSIPIEGYLVNMPVEAAWFEMLNRRILCHANRKACHGANRRALLKCQSKDLVKMPIEGPC